MEYLRCNRFLVKEDYYERQREHRRKLIEERRKEIAKRRQELLPDEPPSNYPGHFTFMSRINNDDFRLFYQQRVLASIRTKEPSVVIDFRYADLHTRVENLKSLYRQMIEIISINRVFPIPFQIHFCNYNHNSEFHQKYGDWLSLDNNLIMETPKSYTEIFNPSQVVYLSKDASKRMTAYDPNKVYVIGAIVDKNAADFELFSYAQAKKDNVDCQRLPIDLFQKFV